MLIVGGSRDEQLFAEVLLNALDVMSGDSKLCLIPLGDALFIARGVAETVVYEVTDPSLYSSEQCVLIERVAAEVREMLPA